MERLNHRHSNDERKDEAVAAVVAFHLFFI